MMARGVFRAVRVIVMAGAALGAASACGGATRSDGNGDGGNGGGGPGGSGAGGGASSSGGASAVNTTLHVGKFDQSCKEAADCHAVHDGNQCGCNQCPTDAINDSAMSAWEAAKSNIGCPVIDCDVIACEPTAYTCKNNRCVVVQAPYIADYDYDQTCLQNEDCSSIPTGQMCDGCGCLSLGAVSNGGYAKWAERVNQLICAGPDHDCGCTNAPTVSPQCVFFAGNTPGKCKIPPPEKPGLGEQYAASYDQRCEADSDCRVVIQGPKCCLQCADFAAISSSAFSAWERDRSLIGCDAGLPLPCPGAPMKPNGCRNTDPPATCVEGMCLAVLLL